LQRTWPRPLAEAGQRGRKEATVHNATEWDHRHFTSIKKTRDIAVTVSGHDQVIMASAVALAARRTNMATIEFWIQIENRAWDVAPNNVDRMTGQNMQQITGKPPEMGVPLHSPESGATHSVTMYRPLRKAGMVEDALILRRYTANWAAPDDRKLNPWDLNEPDPTDSGTMGTIPGPVIECQVGDTVIVHFRNKDNRTGKDVKARTHSLHPHGFVFAPTSDGAYPLSPPDPTQPVGAEAALWSSLGVTGFKKGDRVPPPIPEIGPNGGTFAYTWNTFGWPTTAGVWLYHDHSICDMENVQQGAIGISVIHNPADHDDVTAPALPGGSPNGSPTQLVCFPFPRPLPTLPHDLNHFGLGVGEMGGMQGPMLSPKMGGQEAVGHAGAGLAQPERGATNKAVESKTPRSSETHGGEAPDVERMVRRGDLALELDRNLSTIIRFCLPVYQPPPVQAMYLLLFHNLGDAMMCINGRKYLGNTPTLIAGRNTRMRFGVVGMGNVDGFHTFHIHGHRWVLVGPDGTDPGTIQSSPQVRAVSQFEDTRTFGPANSFGFTINQGSFMGSVFTPDLTRAPGLGEWHMHCHVLTHMMDGMMGSLLVIQGGELAFGLPSGEPCPQEAGVAILGGSFEPPNITIMVGEKVRWTNTDGTHTVSSNRSSGQAFTCSPVSGEVFDSSPMNNGDVFEHTFNSPGTYAYHCEIHGCGMSGTVVVNTM
jgi:plastocyanin/FtsP/CotA-like multicopper oxidase with cupredoxin domain